MAQYHFSFQLGHFKIWMHILSREQSLSQLFWTILRSPLYETIHISISGNKIQTEIQCIHTVLCCNRVCSSDIPRCQIWILFPEVAFFNWGHSTYGIRFCVFRGLQTTDCTLTTLFLSCNGLFQFDRDQSCATKFKSFKFPSHNPYYCKY